MKITADHWIDGVERMLLSGGGPMLTRRLGVVHFTSGATARSSVEFWKSPAAKGACAHVVIERDGSMIQCRPFDRTCGHAGVSKWRDPKTGKLYQGLNACSIGIELANAGDDSDLARRWSKLPLLIAKHRNGGPPKEWERYPDAQLLACRELLQALIARYYLDDITGHDCIAPSRKVDPGPAFPMEVIRDACGFKGLPEVLA